MLPPDCLSESVYTQESVALLPPQRPKQVCRLLISKLRITLEVLEVLPFLEVDIWMLSSSSMVHVRSQSMFWNADRHICT